MISVQEAARREGIVVVGAGQAGGRVVEALRANGFSGRLVLVGDEREKPYERPSLSKEMLLDDTVETVAWVHRSDYLEQQNIVFIPGVAAKRIDRAARKLLMSDGHEIGYGALILATGRRPRPLAVPGIDDPECFYLRSLQDSRVLRERLTPGRRILVVGAGFMGLEVAAAAVQRGCMVTVVEAADTPIARLVPRELGKHLRKEHEGQGVCFEFSSQIVRFFREDGRLNAVTNTGQTMGADLGVIGIGAIPNCELAAEAGLVVENGILTDAFGTTNDSHIFAVGDVADHFNTVFERHVALESWQNAQNGAMAVGRNLAQLGPMMPYAEVPWFWSNQYHLNLQIFGLFHPGASDILRPRPDGSFLHFQMVDGRMVYAAGIDAARDLRPAKDLIAARVTVNASELADPSIPLAEIVRRLGKFSLSA